MLKEKIGFKKRVKRNGISHKQYTPPVDLPLNDSLTLLVNSEVISWIPENLNPGGLRVNSVIPDNRTRTAKVKLNENFTYLPVSSDLISAMRNKISEILPIQFRIIMCLLMSEIRIIHII